MTVTEYVDMIRQDPTLADQEQPKRFTKLAPRIEVQTEEFDRGYEAGFDMGSRLMLLQWMESVKQIRRASRQNDEHLAMQTIRRIVANLNAGRI